MRRFFVLLSDRDFEKLVELALRERRDVRDEAAVIIERYLRDNQDELDESEARDAART